MTEIITKQLNTINHLERKLFWVFSVLLLMASIFYAYLVNQTVLNVVVKENFDEQILSLNSKVGELESKYISVKNQINLDYAHSVGFVEAKNLKFASRKLSTQSLSLNLKN